MGGSQAKPQANVGSVVLITGCSDGGIGASLALEFVAAGFQVVATARSLDSMETLSALPSVQRLVLDVTDFEAVKVVVQAVEQEYGRIDILVNNAGVLTVGPVAEIPLTKFETALKTNVLGPVAMIQAVAPGMAARRRGKIVNIGSITSYSYGPWAGCYAATKAGLEALTDALRMELKPFGVDVLLILPGAIKSNIGKNATSGEIGITTGTIQGLKLYKELESTLLRRANLSQTSSCTPTAEFAKKTVQQILSDRPPRHFLYGRFTTIFLIVHYLPLWLSDFIWCRFHHVPKRIIMADPKAD